MLARRLGAPGSYAASQNRRKWSHTTPENTVCVDDRATLPIRRQRGETVTSGVFLIDLSEVSGLCPWAPWKSQQWRSLRRWRSAHRHIAALSRRGSTSDFRTIRRTPEYSCPVYVTRSQHRYQALASILRPYWSGRCNLFSKLFPTSSNLYYGYKGGLLAKAIGRWRKTSECLSRQPT